MTKATRERFSAFANPVYGCHDNGIDCADILGFRVDDQGVIFYVSSDGRLLSAAQWDLHQLPTFAEAE